MQTLPVVEFSAGGIFALLVIREILNFLRNRKNHNNDEKFRLMCRQVNDLHEQHNVKDPDGVPVWYVRRSLETAILKLTDVVEKLDRRIKELSFEREHRKAP